MSPTIGWIGLGAMGSGMAKSLLSQSFTVQAFDVYAPSLESAVASGAVPSASPVAAAKGASIVALMVVNAAQVEDVLFSAGGVATVLSSGSVVVCFSTVPPSYLASVTSRLAERGVGLCDAPVSGGFVRAAEGQLSVMVAGTPESIQAARPMLEALTRKPNGKLTVVGERAGLASDFKLINQVLCAIHIAVASEAMALGVSMGAHPRQLYEALCASPGTSFMFANRVPWQLADDGVPKSAMTIIHKDSGIVMDEARRLCFPAPLSAAAEQVFSMAVGAGMGREDDGNLVKLYETFGVPSVAAAAAKPAVANDDAVAAVTALLEGVHLVSAAEALCFAAKKGMNLDDVFSVVSNSAAASAALSSRGPRMLAGDTTVHATLDSIRTRIDSAIEAGKRTRTPLFLAQVVQQVLTQAIARGWGAEDDSQLVRLWQEAGVKLK